jgi:hypothetical protein
MIETDEYSEIDMEEDDDDETDDPFDDYDNVGRRACAVDKNSRTSPSATTTTTTTTTPGGPTRTKTIKTSIPMSDYPKYNRRIFFYFYTPKEMSKIKYYDWAKCYGPYSWACNLLGLLANLIVFLMRCALLACNTLTIYATRTEEYPDAEYTHVELSVECDPGGVPLGCEDLLASTPSSRPTDQSPPASSWQSQKSQKQKERGKKRRNQKTMATYFLKWGSVFQKAIQKGEASPDNYRVLCVHFTREDYEILVRDCETAFEKKLRFNYVGNVLNFVVPEKKLAEWFPTEGAYVSSESKFCSEFIAEALSKTESFRSCFRKFVADGDEPVETMEEEEDFSEVKTGFFPVEDGIVVGDGDADVRRSQKLRKKHLTSLVSPNRLYAILRDYAEKNPMLCPTTVERIAKKKSESFLI